MIEVDELAGQELDARVAQQLLGHEVQERTSRTSGRRAFVYNARPHAPTPEWVPVPSYSGSQAASLEVALWLQDQGWKVLRTDADLTRTHVVLSRGGGSQVEAAGAHEYQALCRAALKAVTQ